MDEMDVFNATRSHLRNLAASVFQMVPPGGQAPFSITFHDGNRRRTCYPDFLVVHAGQILVGEMKPRYSVADYRKLIEVTSFGAEQTRGLLMRNGYAIPPNIDVVGVLCHAQSTAPPVPRIDQWIFSAEHGFLRTIRGLDNLALGGDVS